MKHIVDDVRIREIKELSPPGHVLREFPATEKAAITAYNAREIGRASCRERVS
jgi:3-deoxy-7-phosphoheptulonate synthase